MTDYNNNSGTFIYSPDISVVIDSQVAGPIDVSADILNFTVDRQINAVSTFNCTLNNPGRQYNYYGAKRISTMDRITVFLKRTDWVQVFTGYITYAPIETLIPTPIEITASCTLRILQVTYWDDTLIQYQSLLLNFMDNVAFSAQKTLGDGGVASAVVNVLNGVVGWNPKNIHIQGIPSKFISYAATAYTNQLIGSKLNQNAVEELSQALSLNGLVAGGNDTQTYTTNNNNAPDGGIGTGFTVSKARAFITAPIAGGQANYPGPNTMNPVNTNLINQDIYYASVPWSFLQYQITKSLSEKDKNKYQSIQDNAKGWLSNNASTGLSDGRILLVFNKTNNRVVGLRATSVPQKPNTPPINGYAVYDDKVDYMQCHPGVIAYLNNKVDDPTKWNSTTDPGFVDVGVKWANPSKVSNAGPITAGKTDTNNANSILGNGTQVANDPLLYSKAVDKLIYVLVGQLGDTYTQNTITYEGRTVTRMTPATSYGAGNGAFDCSGLARWAYAQIGIKLSYAMNSTDTVNECGPITQDGNSWSGSEPETYGIWTSNTQQPKKGDLLFWQVPSDTGQTPQHVSIMVSEWGEPGPAGTKYANVQGDPNVAYVIEASGGTLGPNCQKIYWDGIDNTSIKGGNLIYVSPGFTGQSYIGARSPLTLVSSWTGSQLQNLSITSTTYTTVVSGAKSTQGDPNKAQQRSVLNLSTAFNNLYGTPQYDLRASAMLGTPRAFLLDNPVMQDLTQIMQAGLRSYMSAPNGDFVAWFPDYYGIYGTDPVLDISPVEILDFQIYHDDNQLATHIGVVGDTNGIGQQVSNVDYITTNGIVSIQDATTMQMLFGSQSISKKSDTQNTISAINFLNKYGMRPIVNEQNMIHSHSLEYMYALYTFMEQWTNQYVSNVTFTFLPEMYPGMRISMRLNDETGSPHTYMFYVTQVTHTGDRSGGFTTQVALTAPMRDGDIMSYGLNIV